MLDRLRHLLRRDAVRGPRRGELAEPLDPRAVELDRLRRELLEPTRWRLRPDRRRDRARLDDRDLDPPRRELEPQRVGHRLERELGHRVRAEERQRRAPADRAHQDDAAARPAQRRQRDAAATRSCPTTLTSSWRCSSSGGRNSSGAATAMPALSTTRVERLDAVERGRDCIGVGDVEDQLAGSRRRLARHAAPTRTRPSRGATSRRAHASPDPARRAGYDGSRNAAISARCSRP